VAEKRSRFGCQEAERLVFGEEEKEEEEEEEKEERRR